LRRRGLDQADAPLRDPAGEPQEGGQVVDILQNLAERFEDDRERRVPSRNFEELRRSLALLPERAALVRVDARHEQRACRALPEARGEQRRPADLVGDDLLQLVGVEHEELGARRLGGCIRNPRDDAVVARDGGSLDTEALADARVDGERPGGVHTHAIRGMQDDAPVTDLVAPAFDGEGRISRERAGRLALLRQVGQQVVDRTLVESVIAQPATRGVGGRLGEILGEFAERLAQLGGASKPVTVPER
jgi:hypothetical protein